MIKVTGFVINKYKINDRDLILEVFTKEVGLISIIYFGINKSLKKEKLSTQLGNLSEFILKETKKYKEYISNYTVVEINLMEKISINDNMYKLNMLFYANHILKEISIKGQENIDLYSKYESFLKYIDKTKIEDKKNMDKALVFWMLRIIQYLGIYELNNILKSLNYKEEEKLKMLLKNEKEHDFYFDLVLKLEKYINHNAEFKINYEKIIFV